MSKAKATKVLKENGFDITLLKDVKPLERITSGFAEVDELIGGGIPKGRVTEIYGMQGVGKTSLMAHCLSQMSQEGKVLYVDAENAMNPEQLKELGANQDNVVTTDTYILEDVADYVIESLNDYDIIVVDSVASLIPRAELDGEIGDANVGLKARQMGKFMRRLIGPLGKSECAVVFINQLRETMEMYGAKRSTPGGHALPYAASLRLELSTTKADRISKTGIGFVGHKVKVTVAKSRVCPPHHSTYFKLMY
jgi:recombination protein RecA